MKHLFLTLIAFFSVVLPAFAQNLKTTTWSSYGVSFQAPADLVVEDDSSEGYIAGNDTYYLTIQLLEGEGLKKEELGSLFGLYVNPESVESEMITPESVLEIGNNQTTTSDEDDTVDSIQDLMGGFDDE